MPNVKILRRALREATEAHEWFELQQTGLGSRFLDRIDELFDEIAENPYRFPVVYDRFRQGIEGRFRYVVYYNVGIEDQVFVHSVVHSSRDQDAVLRSLPH